ncbi:MAG: citrate synthase [Rectinemataceae bacterium]
MGKDSLSITDNRTGKVYDIPIVDGTIRAIDLRAIKAGKDDFGLLTYDPALLNTATARSAITYLDGDAGVLRYRGYPIEQLAAHSTFMETAYLLIFGQLPNKIQLEQWAFDINHHTLLHTNAQRLIESFRHSAHPMSVFIGAISALGSLYPDSRHTHDPENRLLQAKRIIGKVATVGAFTYRINQGWPLNLPDDELDYIGNYLRMMFRMNEHHYYPDPILVKALNVLFILHADHEQNCSTSTMRVIGSSQADPYSSLAGAAAALYGPLHGGANEAVLTMLEQIGSTGRVPAFIDGVKRGEAKLMGFGHRVYKNFDPRGQIIKKMAHEVFAFTGASPLLDIALKLEEIALHDEYFISRKLYPNVDFYSGLIYQAMKLPTNIFTVMFAIPRSVGWVAQWMEMMEDEDLKIVRPRQIYTGEDARDYAMMEERK